MTNSPPAQTATAQCLGKVAHATEQAARQAVAEMRRRKITNVIYYPCDTCGRFHTCHGNGGIRRNRQAYKRKGR